MQPARWAHRHRFPSVCLSSLDQNSDLTIIHNSKSIAPRVMKFGHVMDVGDLNLCLEGQGHRSNVKVTRVT